MQLRLQKTVEGLSVVAISYYAVQPRGLLIAPVAEPLGVDKTLLTALGVLPVVGGLVLTVRSTGARWRSEGFAPLARATRFGALPHTPGGIC